MPLAAPSPGSRSNRAACLRWLVALALLGLVVAVFHPVRKHEFTGYDDKVYITDNPYLRSGLTPENVMRAFTEPYFSNWIPLTRISFQLDYELYGLEPAGYLLTNAVLHALSTLLLFAALVRMTRATWPSAFVAAVFAVHPLHVESVAWAAERKDALAGVFWMLGMLAWARYAERPSLGAYGIVALCLALGLLAKPVVVTLPLALLLLDYWPLRRLAPAGAATPWPLDRARLVRAVLEKLPLLVLVAAASAVTFVVQRQTGAMDYADHLPFDQRFANAVVSYVVYLAQSVWPSGLAVFYPHLGDGLPVWQVAGSAALLALLTALALRWARTRPYLAIGWIWYLGTLVPVIGLVQVGLQAHADRYMYLPLVGLAIAVAWGAADLASLRRGARQLLAVAGAVAIAGLAFVAWQQVKTWRDTVTLFERAVAVTEDNYVAHTNLAAELLLLGRVAEAELHYREGVRIQPDSSEARLGWADALAVQGRLGEALGRYEEVLRRNPNETRIGIRAAGHYGLALLRVGRFAEARDQLERALAVHGEIAELHVGMALASSQLGDFARAVHHGREALRLDPALDSAANNLAWILATSPDPHARNPEESIRIMGRLLREAERPDPAHLDTLAAAYAAAGRFPDAIDTATRAEKLAREEQRSAMVEQIRVRLAGYREGESWIERPASDGG
jgi:tetratricopeptide (TPR) repeat protein